MFANDNNNDKNETTALALNIESGTSTTATTTTTTTAVPNVFQSSLTDSNPSHASSTSSTSDRIPPYIHDANNNPILYDNSTMDRLALWWQYAPISSDRSIINLNVMTRTLALLLQRSDTAVATMSPIHYYQAPKPIRTVINNNDTIEPMTNNTNDPNKNKTAEAVVDSMLQKHSTTYTSGDPYGYIYYPIPRDSTWNDPNRSEVANGGDSIAAIASITILWKSYFENVVPKGHGMVCVINNTMGQIFTLSIDATSNVQLIDYDDVHEPNFDYLRVSYILSTDERYDGSTDVPFSDDFISYTIHLYPSQAMKDSYITSTPIIVAFGMILCFLITLYVFCFYDGVVSKRQKLVMDNAYKTYSIVSSLFPATVRDRMIQDNTVHNESATALGRSANLLLQKNSNHSNKTKFDAATAIADFYPAATVLCTYYYKCICVKFLPLQ
jgi:hypothetical protein